jgi:nucleoside-diphosphate-sugar epimerase
MATIVITGANGFIGRSLCERLVADGHSVIATVRSPNSAAALPPGINAVSFKPITPETDWSDVLSRADVVVHLAARVHIMRDSAADPASEFRKLNVLSTSRLFQQAIQGGVKRFVFLSSIGVNGNATPADRPFTEQNPPAPHNPYSRSKLEAEQTLQSLAVNSPMEIVTIRAPIVYGVGNPANALRLLQAVHLRRPLPFASVQNRRSLIYLGNLVDAIALCCVHPRAARQLFLVSDREDVSTPELIRRIAAAFGVEPRLLPVPPALMFAAATLLGKRDLAERLIGSLAVDSSKIVRELGWKPPYSMEQGLAATAKWFLTEVVEARL